MKAEEKFLISKFMDKDESIIFNEYDYSWDSLMPVVKKCYCIVAPTEKGWSKAERIENIIPRNSFESNNIDDVYGAVVKFIKLYNGKKENN